MKKLDAIIAARNCLENLTPLRLDCGRYCGGACCEADESGENGMCLLPGEEELYPGGTEAFPYRLLPDHGLTEGGFRLVCEGKCQRENRPFACRVFPLRIRVLEKGCLAEPDPRAWAICPLLERGGLTAMRREFTEAVTQAGDILLQNEEIRDALLKEQIWLDEERKL